MTGENSWAKMVEMLVKKDQDVVAEPFIFNLERYLKVDYGLPVRKYGIRLYFRLPAAKSSGDLYFLPFARNVWFAIVFSLIGTGFLLWIVNKAEVSYTCMQDDIVALSPTNATWNIFVRLLQRDPGCNPSTHSCQIILLVWSASAFIIATSYSAVLVSFLTTLKPVYPFRTFEGILRRPDWQIVANKYSAIKDNLRLAPEGSIYKKVWKINVEPDLKNNMVNSTEEALKKLIKGKYAYLATDSGIDTVLKEKFSFDETVQIVDTGEDYFTGRMAFGFQKHSPFIGLFNHYISKITSTGHLHRFHKYFFNKKRKSKPATEYARPGFSEVFVLFACLGVGLIASLFILTLEIWINSRRKKNFKKALNLFI